MALVELTYPGDEAEPKAVAKYFEATAISYGLPGILPVMTSYVELTAAWLVPGDVKQVFGYLKAVDHFSVGYFQQQYDDNPNGLKFGWGKYRQLIKAEYALKRFCEEAVLFLDHEWHANTTDPEILGRWCQAIQRSATPNAYRDKGYPAALELIKVLDEWPQEELAFTDQGWLYVVSTGKFARLPEGTAAYANKDRWGKEWVEEEVEEEEQPEVFTWPEAWAEPKASGSYDQMFPTRYNWTAPVEAWARYIVQTYGVWVNTYYAHPPYWWKETVSFDVWDWAGRGYNLDPTVGDNIFWELFNFEGAPDIDWIIYKGKMWTRAGGWTDAPPGAADSDPGHWKHIHVTFV